MNEFNINSIHKQTDSYLKFARDVPNDKINVFIINKIMELAHTVWANAQTIHAATQRGEIQDRLAVQSILIKSSHLMGLTKDLIEKNKRGADVKQILARMDWKEKYIQELIKDYE